jgi:hypothetical protein
MDRRSLRLRLRSRLKNEVGFLLLIQFGQYLLEEAMGMLKNFGDLLLLHSKISV